MGTHERNPIPLCSAVISSNDASTQQQRKARFAEQKLNLMEGATANRMSGVTSQEEGNLPNNERPLLERKMLFDQLI